jgi:hypothetical protein
MTRAAKTLCEALKGAADLRFTEEVNPEAEFVVLRECPLGQVSGADQ